MRSRKDSAAAEVLLGDAHHQAQVGLGELAPRLLVALLDGHGVLHLLLLAEEGDAANLAEVHPHRIVEGDGAEGVRGLNNIVVAVVDGLEVAVPVGDLNAHVPEEPEETLQVIRLGLDLGETRARRGGEVALLLALDDERLGGEDELVAGAGRGHHRSPAQLRRRHGDLPPGVPASAGAMPEPV